jgi:glycosyltransferase involved in cell wall biosynthesis
VVGWWSGGIRVDGTPLISAIVPMRNARAFIGQAVRSLLAQADESFRLEVVVVDDGSTDGSAEVVRAVAKERPDVAVRMIDGPRNGISAAMNAGLEAAKGEWVCRCDADDWYPAGRLPRQLQWLAAHPEFGAVCGSFSNVGSKGQHVADLNCGATAQEITEELRGGKTRTHLCTWLVRAAAVRRAGMLRTWFVSAEDIDLQLRLGEVCRVWYEPAVAYAYRLHEASVTHTQANDARLFYERTARQFAVQRREAGEDDLQRGSPPTPPGADGKTIAPMSAADHVQGMLVGQSWREHARGRKLRALLIGLRACLAKPRTLSAWRNVAALALKRAGTNAKPG